MLLITYSNYAYLLSSYKNLDIKDFIDLFSIGIYSYKNAAYLLDIVKNKEDTILKNITS
jgi:hypothetical protein